MTVKRDFFAALVGAKYSLRQQQMAVSDVRELQRFGAQGTAPGDWDRFAVFLTHWEVFITDELERFGKPREGAAP